MQPLTTPNWVENRSIVFPPASRWRTAPRRAGWLLLLLLSVAAGSCGKPQVGDSCDEDADCPSGLCVGPGSGFPDGYCSSDCTTAGCGEGQSCAAVAEDGPLICLRGCTTNDDCQDSAQCYKGACNPRCKGDEDCRDDGYSCDAGTCTARPGSPMGDACTKDSDCSSQNCVMNKCVQGCNRETACAAGSTCVLDRNATRVRGSCISQRTATRAPLNACASDSDCTRGTCLMGLCLLMCQQTRDCGAAPDAGSCPELPAPLTKVTPVSSWPRMKVCLPRNQNVAVPLGAVQTVNQILVPSTARSLTMVLSAENNDQSIRVGMSYVEDDKKMELFGQWNPADPNGYFNNVIRHNPDGGSSIFMFSTSPGRAPLRSTVYGYGVVASDPIGMLKPATALAIYKLYDAPITSGKVPLRIHVADLSGLPPSCMYQSMKAASARTTLAPMISKLQQIYAQSNVAVTFDPIDYDDTDAPTSLNAQLDGALGKILAQASKQTAGGVDLTLIRSIAPTGVLGIAGGIPGAPGMKDNPRTGAVMSMGFLCMSGVNYGLTQLAQTAAHELGHTLGLNHNRERGGMTDPLGDGTGLSESTRQDSANLMYWLSTETPGESLTAEQGTVIRSVPQIRP